MLTLSSQPTNDEERQRLSPSDRSGVEDCLPVLPPECIAIIIGHLLMSGSFESIIPEWKGEALRQFRLLSPRSRMRLAITTNSRTLVNVAMEEPSNSVSARGWEAPLRARRDGRFIALDAMIDHRRSQSLGVQRRLHCIAACSVRS
jgi:hypothetical protein